MQVPAAKHDLLFVNDWVYQYGLKEEFAICAYYDDSAGAGAGVCNGGLTGWRSPVREQARSNLYWYLSR